MATYNGQVTGGGLNLRSSDSTSSTSPIQIPNNTSIVVSDYSQNGSWYCTTYGGYSGFVLKQYVNIISAVSTRSCNVTGGGLNLRYYPNTSAPSPIQIPNGQAVTVQEHNSTWSSLTYSGYSGFVMSQYLTGSSGGGDGGVTGTYTAIICQGDTDSASDARIAHTKLSAKYGSSAIAITGFSLSSNTPFSPCSNSTNFNSAKNYDVLYWTGHGSSNPSLNVVKGPSFASYANADSNWNSPSYRLKVPIFSACSQFDGATNRSRWASVMRKSNIRAMLGYHAVSPAHPSDEYIARDFFDLCAAGNSCMYSWKNANTPNSGGNYLILVYNDGDRCYYRLPGYPGATYADPNRASTSIYAYASFATGGTQINSLGAPLAMSESMPVGLSGSVAFEMPYELEIVSPSVKAAVAYEDDSLVTCKLISDEATGAYFKSFGEASLAQVEGDNLSQENMRYITRTFGGQLLENAIVTQFNDVMMEVREDGTEGPQKVIGHTTVYRNHFNGIPLDRNCIVVSSDANGINSVTNLWIDVAPMKNTMMIKQENSLDTLYAGAASRTLPQARDVESADYTYILKDGRYVLQRDVRTVDGNHIYIDCMTNEVS